MSASTELLVIVALVLANAAFAGAEIAVLSVRKSRLLELAEEGSGAARTLLAMRAKPEDFLATVQIGITVISIAAGAFGGLSLARDVAALLRSIGLERSADDVALVAVVSLVSFLSLVIGELVPKSLALRHAEAFARAAARPLRFASLVAWPFVRILTASSNVVLRVFKDETSFSESRLSREELEELVDEAATVGSVEPRAGEIASRALEFGRTRVAAVMVPRLDMISVPRDAGRAEVHRLLRERFHERFPVHGGSPDDVVGYVTASDLFEVATSDAKTVADVVREALYVPETILALDVLEQMQVRRIPLALVVDEQGSVVGLATVEDLTEELVGHVFSEHETRVERIHREADGTAIVRGVVPVHEVNRELGLDLPIGTEWSTIAGLAVAHAGAIPKPGARLELGDGTILEVLDASDRRVTQLRIVAPREASEEVRDERT